MPEIQEFTSTQIKNASIQLFEGGQKQPGQKFGCMGTLEAETEIREKTKTCEGRVETIAIPLYQNVTVGAHIRVDVLREIFGIKTEGLKAGVHSYGINSRSKKFIFTADEIDEFGDVVKLIAYPNCSAVSGLTLSVDNDADDVAYTEIEFRAHADGKGNFFYDAFVGEVATEVADDWHINFTPELIEEPEV